MSEDNRRVINPPLCVCSSISFEFHNVKCVTVGNGCNDDGQNMYRFAWRCGTVEACLTVL